MSESLLDQLDLYGTDFETALVPTELDDVVTGSRRISFAPTTPAPRYPTSRWASAAVVAVLVVVVVGGVAWLLRGNAEQDVVQTTVTTLPVTTIPAVPVNPEATDVIVVGGWPSNPLVAADGVIWLADSDSGSVTRIDATTRQVTDTIAVGVDPTFMFPTEDGLWVLDIDGGEVLLVDTVTRQVADSIRIVGPGGQAITPVLVGETLWVHTNTSGPGTVLEVDLTTRQVLSESRVGQNAAWWAEAIDGAIWSYAPSDGLRRFDLDTHETEVFGGVKVGHTEECCIALDDAIWLVSHEGLVQRFDLAALEVTDQLDIEVTNPNGYGGLARGLVAAGAIWIPHGGDGVVYRIDPVSREVTDVIPVGSQPGEPVFADGAIWFPNQGDGTVSRIDIESRQVTRTIQVGSRPRTPLAFNEAIWVPNLEDGTVTRIQTR